MRKQLFNLGIAFGFILSILFIAGGLLGFVDMGWFSPEGVGLAMAAGAATGEVSQEKVTTDVTKAKSSELLVNHISKNITRMHPDKYPMDTILREMSNIIPIKSWRTEYYEVETRMLEDTVKTTLAASGTTGAAWATHTLAVDNPHMWAVDDNIMVQGINGADSKELVLHVLAKSSSNLTVLALNGLGTNGSDVPEIAEDTELTRIGVAKEETAATTSPYAVFPQKQYNYAQIFMATVEESFYDMIHDKEVNWDLSDMRSEALWDLRSQMELASIFGVRAYAYDSVAEKYKYFAGGVTRYMTESSSFAASGFNNANFVTLAQSTFTGNNGSETRIMFAGSGARATMAKAPTIQKQMEQRDVEVIWGVKFNRIETDFGTLLVKHHPLLNYAGYSDKAIILDMNNVEKHSFKALETSNVDYSKSGQRKTKADTIDEAFCTALKNPDTHRIVSFT